MTKEQPFQEKINLLRPWFTHIISEVKKDLKNDHLKNDAPFTKKYFNKPYHKVEVNDLTDGYLKAIDEGSEQVLEYISQRWILKHGDMYQYFAEELEKIDPDFSKIEEIEPSLAKKIAEKSSEQFGTTNTYLFSIINSVVFPKTVLTELSEKAKQETVEAEKLKKEHLAFSTQEALIKDFETKIQRLTDKYEKKLAGLEMKYVNDTESLKKQISNLQKKLA